MFIPDTIAIYAEQCEAERRAALLPAALLSNAEARRAYHAYALPQDDGDPHFLEEVYA